MRPLAIAFALVGCLVALVLAVMIYHLRAPEAAPFVSERVRLQAQIEPLIQTESSNTLVGITRIVSWKIDDTSEDPNEWRAEVTAEHATRLGGAITRTNLPFRFSKLQLPESYDQPAFLNCILDLAEIHRRMALAFDPYDLTYNTNVTAEQAVESAFEPAYLNR